MNLYFASGLGLFWPVDLVKSDWQWQMFCSHLFLLFPNSVLSRQVEGGITGRDAVSPSLCVLVCWLEQGVRAGWRLPPFFFYISN